MRAVGLASFAAGSTDHTTVELPAAMASVPVVETESVALGLSATAPAMGASRLATQTTVRTETLLYQTPT
uniref:Uncharacterized protein n=1 Tax=Arundo donax TaxID=35708 RepID=A0A0A9GIR3_ARUDO